MDIDDRVSIAETIGKIEVALNEISDYIDEIRIINSKPEYDTTPKRIVNNEKSI